MADASLQKLQALDLVMRATLDVADAKAHQVAAVQSARESGASLREIAEALGMSHEQVRRMLGTY